MSRTTVRPKQPILVLGGGINGAAIARQFVLSGVPVWIVDSHDIASGTTAASSRLIHGGLRYLEYGEFGLVRESLLQRARLLRLAPHLVRPLKLFIPVRNRFGGLRQALTRFFARRDRSATAPVSRGYWLVQTGLWIYDWFSRRGRVPRRGRYGVAGQHGFPDIDPATTRWICSFYDAQILFPERLVVEMLTHARQVALDGDLDFQVLTRHQVLRDGADYLVCPVEDDPGSNDQTTERICPLAVINATGAWVDECLGRLDVPSERLMGGTKGSHFVTFHPALRQHLQEGGVYAEASDGRPIFLLPLANGSLVGTTDIPSDDPPESARATPAELDYLTNSVNRLFPDVKLTSKDICLHYCGVRPLPFVSAATPAAITRRHCIKEHDSVSPPLFSVIGGKLTTCGAVAEQTVAAVMDRLAIDSVVPNADDALPGDEPHEQTDSRQAIRRLALESGVSWEQAESAWLLFGAQSRKFLPGLPTSDQQPLLTGTLFPVSLVQRVIDQEWVKTVGDLVERRLMLLYAPALSRDTLEHLAKLLVDRNRLEPEKLEAEIDQYCQYLQQRFGRTVSGWG